MKTLRLLAAAALICLLALSCKKKEPVLVSTITMSESYMEMMPGDTRPLTVTCTPDNAENLDKLVVESSDERVMEYHDGVVIAKEGGTAFVRATCGSVLETCRVKVYYGWFYKADKVFGVDEAGGYHYMMGTSKPQEMDIVLTKKGAGDYESQNLKVWISCKYLGSLLDFTKPIEETCFAAVYANNNEDGYMIYSSSSGTPMIVTADWSFVDGITLSKGELRIDDMGGHRYKIHADFKLSDGYAFGTDWEGPVVIKEE